MIDEKRLGDFKPPKPKIGFLRENSDLSQLELYDGERWRPLTEHLLALGLQFEKLAPLIKAAVMDSDLLEEDSGGHLHRLAQAFEGIIHPVKK